MRPPATHLAPYRVYGDAASGNCHKVKLALDLLGLPYRWHAVDVLGGETRTPEFLARNSSGKVPVLQIDDHTFLPESNAILCYLADGTPLWPGDRLQRARVLQWLFFEQYSHEPYIAVARFIQVYLHQPEDPRLPNLIARGNAALAVMERHLAAQPFFVGDALTIADIALFAYTHKAHEGGFDLAPYPALRAWLARCLAVPGMSEMPGR
jgi:glutathione S-transferase